MSVCTSIPYHMFQVSILHTLMFPCSHTPYLILHTSHSYSCVFIFPCFHITSLFIFHVSFIHISILPYPIFHNPISHNSMFPYSHTTVHLLETRIAMQTFEEDHLYNIYNSNKILGSSEMIMLCLGLYEQAERHPAVRTEPLYVNRAVELTASWIRDVYDM